MRFILYPTTDRAIKNLRTSLRNRETVVILGRCTVKYVGRSSSTLQEGERLLIIKQDGATLIHRPHGYRAVNWQPPRNQIRAFEREGKFVVKISRRTPREVLNIQFDELKILLSDRMEDYGEFYMYGTEKDIQRAILAEPEIVEKGLRRLRVEKEHPEGYIDMMAEDKDGRIVVIEIKRKKATAKDLFQTYKYVSEYRKTNPFIRGILVAPALSKSALKILHQLNLEFCRINLEALKNMKVRKIE